VVQSQAVLHVPAATDCGLALEPGRGSTNFKLRNLPRELPRSLLILGGGYVALELGQMFRRFGSEVTILERSQELLAHGYEPQIGPAVREVFEREDIRVITGAIVHAVRTNRAGVVATVSARARTEEVRAERLLVATGRRPNTDLIAIERAGVKLGSGGEVLVDEFLCTNVPHIFAAGDVVGREQGSQMATPVGSHDGRIAAHNALSAEPPHRVDHRVIPRAILIDPPVAIVGMTEAQAVAAGHPCWCNTVPMSLVPRANAIHATHGFVKMVADADTHEVLGVSMFGHAAPEVIHEAAMGLRFRAKVHRPAARVPHDGRSAQDRGDLEVQGPCEALLLRRVRPVWPRPDGNTRRGRAAAYGHPCYPCEVVARTQADVRRLAAKIGALAPADRAKLLARLLQDEQRREDWSVIDCVRARSRGKGSRALKAKIDRAVHEVRSERARRTG
jgi:hypothetical protein